MQKNNAHPVPPSSTFWGSCRWYFCLVRQRVRETLDLDGRAIFQRVERGLAAAHAAQWHGVEWASGTYYYFCILGMIIIILYDYCDYDYNYNPNLHDCYHHHYYSDLITPVRLIMTLNIHDSSLENDGMIRLEYLLYTVSCVCSISSQSTLYTISPSSRLRLKRHLFLFFFLVSPEDYIGSMLRWASLLWYTTTYSSTPCLSLSLSLSLSLVLHIMRPFSLPTV